VRGNSFHGGDIGGVDMLVTSVIPSVGGYFAESLPLRDLVLWCSAACF
jgi:hypothetical protein